MYRSALSMTLQNISPFQSLAPCVIETLSPFTCIYELEIGDVLYEQGTLAEEFYIVLEGGVRLAELTSSGKVVGLKIYGQGDVFGLLAISGNFPHPSRVEAIQPSVIIGISGQDARQVMVEFGEFGLLITDLLIKHVHVAHHRIREMGAERVERRLARTLLLLCQKFGRPTNDFDNISIDMPITQQDLAEFTASTVETVNRILKKWHQQELIHLSRMRITVLRPDELTAIIENSGI